MTTTNTNTIAGRLHRFLARRPRRRGRPPPTTPARTRRTALPGADDPRDAAPRPRGRASTISTRSTTRELGEVVEAASTPQHDAATRHDQLSDLSDPLSRSPLAVTACHRLCSGRPGGNRTPNLRFWRPPLCQLSYWPIHVGKVETLLFPFAPKIAGKPSSSQFERARPIAYASPYSMILATTPAPTVRPPSRIAKRSPSSIAIGWISVTVIAMLSPGITISVPAGSSQLPVTSVVRK